MFTEEATIFIVRFTITPEEGKPMVLYQPVWSSAKLKGMLRQTIGTIRAKG